MSKKYIRAYNNGYFLARYEPNLLQKVLKATNPSLLYIRGLNKGKEQYKNEYNLSIMAQLTNLRQQSQMRQNDLTRD